MVDRYATEVLVKERLMDEVALLRPAEAARELGISLRRLRRLAASGHIVTVRTLGGHRRYRSDDVFAFDRWRQRQSRRDVEEGVPA